MGRRREREKPGCGRAGHPGLAGGEDGCHHGAASPGLRPRPDPPPVTPDAPTAHAHGPFTRLSRWSRSCIRDGRWLPRALLLAVLAYLLLRYLGDAAYRPFFGPVNLITHEAGHALFSWSGSRWLTVAGGTLFELAVPVAFAVAFVRQRDPFAVAVALFWLGTALVDVSIYVGDARTRALPLVSLWPGPPIHDWSWLLSRAGRLAWDRPLSRLFRHGGLAFMGAALLWGGVVVRQVRAAAADGVLCADGPPDDGESWSGRTPRTPPDRG